MKKCEEKYCRNEMDIIHLGKALCNLHYKELCDREEKEWMEKQWNKTLMVVGI